MKKFRLLNINLLCYCLFKLAIVNCLYDKKLYSKYSKSSEKYQHVLMNKFMMNLGINPNDFEKTEKYAQLSQKLPHIVPDFMRSLFAKYRFKLFNLSLEIEGKRKHLGNIELIQSRRLKEILTWPKAGIHKLIFKENTMLDFDVPSVRELRLNKKLFPRQIFKRRNNTQNEITILSIFNNRFQIIKKLIIKDSSFSADGWLSVDISKYSNDHVFFLKFYKVFSINKNNFKQTELKIPMSYTKEGNSYYANIINFFKNKNPIKHQNQELYQENHFTNTRVKRDLSQYSLSHNEDCQRHPLVVKFKEVGWSKWIIAPQNYNAYYCKGNCPYPLSDNFNATNHAIIQLLVHGLKDVSVPKPCCVPYQLTPETLLYLNNEGDALLREFKDMSVNSCSCR